MTMTTKHMPTITYQASAAVSTFRLPTFGGFVVTVTDGQLATIGGYRGDYSDTNKLFGLTGEGSGRKWTEKFPPMPCQLNVPTCLHCALKWL